MSSNYEIQIKGHLDSEWAEWFPGFTFTHRPDGTTVLSGPISDQPALHGLLTRINQLGLPLLKVEQIGMEDQNE